MSLVAYGSDSDSSDSEEVSQEQKSEKQQEVKEHSQFPRKDNDNATKELNSAVTGGYISDEDEYESVSSTSTSSFTQPSQVQSQVSKPSSNQLEDQINSTSVTSLDDLPAPQVRTLDNTNTVEEELEEEVKAKASEIASAPKPPGKKTKQTVKITIPSLDETSDDEDKAELRKNVSSTSKSSLFSLLPAPMHSAKKEINRPLIPHTLTKKAAPPKKPMTSESASQKSVNVSSISQSGVASSSETSTKRMSQFNALTGYDSDSDEENDQSATSSNFFSLASTSKPESSGPSASSSRLQSGVVSSSRADSSSGSDSLDKFKPNVSSSQSSSSEVVEVTNSKDVITEGSSEVQMEEETVMPQPEPGFVNDSPLDFGSKLKSWSGYLNPVGLSGPVSSLSQPVMPAYQNPYGMSSNNVYNMANTENTDYVVQDETDEVPNDDLKQFMSDKEFQRLQGKRKRGMEESINFVDANVDDYVDPSEVTKHLTEETEYSSHKNKDNMPTTQQRKKKQITYLAYQAKERELELKNTWAMNKMSKMATQSKYGF